MTGVCVLLEGGTEGRHDDPLGFLYLLLTKLVRVRLYSTRTLKALGTLDYHKKSCQAVAFARYLHERAGPLENEEDTEDEMSEQERADRRRWLVAGSQDNRVSMWSLISFEKPSV